MITMLVKGENLEEDIHSTGHAGWLLIYNEVFTFHREILSLWKRCIVLSGEVCLGVAPGDLILSCHILVILVVLFRPIVICDKNI